MTGHLIKREMRLARSNAGALLTPLLFYLIISTLYPLGISPQGAILAAIAPGIVWIGALLASLLIADGLFRSDYEQGVLEQVAVSGFSWLVFIYAKLLAQWLLSGLPLILFALLCAAALGLPANAFTPLLIGLILGTPLLSMIAALGSALTISLHQNGILLAVIVVPLYIPILIFGTSAVNAGVDGQPWSAPLYFLAALLCLGITFIPFAIAAALKANLN